MTEISRSEQDTVNIGRRLGERLKPGDAVLFNGEMGNGKTYLTKGIGKALLVEDEIVSPTFSLVREYQGKLPMYHFDLFRINDFDALLGIGFFDYVATARNGVMVIEWSENIKGLEFELSKEMARVFKINIKKISQNEREIEIDDSIGD
ncbi:MAG: tRNA (adenosine(37)-N6)-threonylcarbamoyltransferase complex ATPase subunit type 1 TsaE [Eubacterium sp.]|jgi:tRNA threonylcarbamoyladenosine biosynthesis protein TsaE|nr:tRNA (adenosine(37)-N6)-threonylcarbamoyltransferase complex ATPase subunit type 1 TsaE [Eubacterium sp.]